MTALVTHLPRHTEAAGTLTAHEIAAKAGVSYKRVHLWTAGGLVPGMAKSVGHGVQREYTVEQAHFVMRLARLVRAGFDVRIAASALAEQTVNGRLPSVLRLEHGVELHLTSLQPQAVAQ